MSTANFLSKVESASRWLAVVGLEIHAQIATESKLFSGASTQPRAPANSLVAHLDAALPGTLPVLNKRCVEHAVLTSKALNCTVNLLSKFDRKHYFYFDLPAGYQITQHFHPLANDGYLDYYVYGRFAPYKKRTRISQVQLEQDSGKSVHDHQAGRTLVDLNRAGIGLMEIITEPNMTNGREALCFVQELQLLLRALGTCRGQMEKGQLRVDANISVHRENEQLGVRTEVKNINSFRFVQQAIDFEIARHIRLLETGAAVENETRYFDYRTHATHALRDKEILHDYRYLPEPNLPALCLHSDRSQPVRTDAQSFVNVDAVTRTMPLLPSERLHEWVNHGAYLADALPLFYNDDEREFVERCVSECTLDKIGPIILLFRNEFSTLLHTNNIKLEHSLVSPKMLVTVATLYAARQITRQAAAFVLQAILRGDARSVEEIVAEKKFVCIDDPDRVKEICRNYLNDNPDKVSLYCRKSANPKKMARVLEHMVNSISERTNAGVDCEHVRTLLPTLIQCK